MEPKPHSHRFHPTADQARELARIRGCVRHVHNGALTPRAEAWCDRHERIDHAETDRLPARVNKDPEKSWLAEVSRVPLQPALRHLNAACVNSLAGRAKDPRFHHMRDRQAATHRMGGFRWRDERLTPARMDAPLKIRWTKRSRAQAGEPYPFSGEPTSGTVRRDRAARYFVSFSAEEEAPPVPVVNATAGLDPWLLATVVLSTGEQLGNKPFLRRDEERFGRAQRSLARKQTGSVSRGRARRKVARIDARIADRRRELSHRLTTRISRENRVVCTEGLNVEGVLAQPKLAESIAAAGWGERPAQLECGVRRCGRTFVGLGRLHPSGERCQAGGHVVESLPLNVRCWGCPSGGAALDRDVNAARNIRDAGLAAGLAVSARGRDVRPRGNAPGPQRSGKPR